MIFKLFLFIKKNYKKYIYSLLYLSHLITFYKKIISISINFSNCGKHLKK